MADTINLDELGRLSAETGFSSKLLEKDYHLTKILQRIREKKIKNLVLKGGTCLNKCYLGFYRGAWMTLFLIGNNHEPSFLEKEAESIKDFHEKMREREEKEAEMDEGRSEER